jgi:hypothetical protein
MADDKILRLAPHLPIEDVRFVGERRFSSDTLQMEDSHWDDTAIGRVGVGPDASIIFQDFQGITRLTEKEAMEIGRAFMHYSYRSSEIARQLSGYHVVKIDRHIDGSIHGTFRDETCKLRFSQLRKSRPCDHCKLQAMGLWVNVGGAKRGPEVCAPCVEKLVIAPKGIREIE